MDASVSTDSGHREPGVESGPSRVVVATATLERPIEGRALRGRPPARLHPTEQLVLVRGVSVGLPTREAMAAAAPTRKGSRGRLTKQDPRPTNGGRASSALPKGPFSPIVGPI